MLVIINTLQENNKIESRIPLFYTRESAPKSTEHNFLIDKSSNLDLINVNLRKKSKNIMENSSNRGTSQEENIRYYIILIIYLLIHSQLIYNLCIL